MAKLDDFCKHMLSEVDGALGFAVVDLPSGLLLAVAHKVPYFTHTFLDAAAAAAVEMFRGRTVTTIERLIASQRGTPPKRWVTEIHLTTDDTYHFMTLVPGKPNALVVMITSKQTNPGLGWAALHNALLDLAAMIP